MSDCALTVLALVAAVTLVAIIQASPGYAYAKPDTTTSVYESTTTLSTIEAQAQTQATNGRSGTVILDFGRPAYSTTSGTGYIDFGNSFVTRAQVLSAVEHYARYWWMNAAPGAHVNIAIGTSNSDLYTSSNCPCYYQATNLTQFGVEFGQDVSALQSNIVSAGYTGTTGQGAIDAEPAWDPTSQGTQGGSTRQILAGYNSASRRALYDYGSAEPGYWSLNTEADIAYGVNVSAGNRRDYPDNYPFPEIYYSSQASEWESIDCYDHQNSVKMTIVGVLTEQPASGTYTYQAAYDAMMAAMASGCSGSTMQSSISYSSNI